MIRRLTRTVLALGGLAAAAPGTAGPAPDPPRLTAIALDLSLDPGAGLLRETATLTLTGSGQHVVELGVSEALSVEGSSASEGIVEHRKAGERIHLSVDPPLTGPRTFTLRLSGELPGIRSGSVVLGPDDGFYPSVPGMWASAEVRVSVPEGWAAAAPGGPAGPGRWRSRRPLRSIAVAAAPGLVATEGTAVETPLRVVGPPGDLRAEAAAALIADPLAWLSGALAPYPFESLTLVRIPGYAGRTRASGMIVTGLLPLATPADAADLLADQWFGERVAGDGAWIQAFAAWQALVYSRDRGVPPPAELARLRQAFFEIPGARDVALAAAGPGAAPEVLRGKGSAAAEALRLSAGDRAVAAAVRDLFERPPGAPLGLSGIRAAFEARAGRPLARAFADWFERPGAPDLRATLRVIPASGGGYRADLDLSQAGAAYALPVEVAFLGPGQEHRETVDVEGDVTSVFYVLPFPPVRVQIDPTGRLYRRPEGR